MRFYAIEAGLVGGSQWVLSMDIGQAVDPSAITIRGEDRAAGDDRFSRR